MTQHDPLDQQIVLSLNAVAQQVPIRDRLTEITAAADRPAAHRWRFSQVPALAGAAAFLAVIAIVGGGLLVLRSNTNDPATPVGTTSTTATTTTAPTPTVDVVPGAGGPCLNERNNPVGQPGVQVRSASQVINASFGHNSLGYCPDHPEYESGQLVRPYNGDGFFADLQDAVIEFAPGAALVVTAPGYPGATLDARWSSYSAANGADSQLVAALATSTSPGEWTVAMPEIDASKFLSLQLIWPEGQATYAVVLSVEGGPQPAAGMPSDYDAGPQLDAEIRSQLPPSYIRLGFTDGVALVSIEGAPLGHVRGQPEVPVDPRDRTQQLTNEYADWGIPDGCVVDAVVEGTHLRILCIAPGESPDGPTVELLFPDGRREVVAELTEPPSDLEGAVRLGRFLEVLPSPWNRGASLAQLSVECEAPLAVMINDGIVYHMDRTPWWGDAYPAGESVAVGWSPDQRALVWRFNGLCSAGLDVPGIYIYDIGGFGALLFAVPDAVQWVEVVNPPEATDTAAIYPAWTTAQLEDLITAGTPLLEDFEVVAAFATDMLGLADPEVVGVGDATDAATWEVAGNGFVASIRSQIIAWRADGSAINAITYASTFTSSDDFFLAAQVENNDGSWTAEFHFPEIGDETTVVFSSADWTVQATTSGGVVTLDLPDEPIETPRLKITYRTGGDIVGFHGILLPAGEFAAG